VTRGVLLTFFPALLLQTWNDFLILFFPIEREHSMAGDKKSGNFSSYFEGIAQDSTPWKCWLLMDQLILHDPQHCLKSNSIKGIKKQVKGFFFSASEQTKESFHNCTSSNWKGRNRGSVNSIELANDFR
jgi:hypothetical protein